MQQSNIINLSTNIVILLMTVYFVYSIYRKQDEKTKLWKVILILVVGFFSFSIKLPSNINIAVLPLGVWLIIAIYRNQQEKWENIRKYAWTGFLLNYLFLIAALINHFMFPIFYPYDKLDTFVSSIENAKLIATHPTAKDNLVLNEGVMDFNNDFKKANFFADDWYYETYGNEEPQNRNERFPYLLSNVTPKWGSDLEPTIFVEKDGKGLLVVESNNTVYFKTSKSILREVE